LLAFLLLAAPLVAGAFLSTGFSWGWDHLHRLGLPAALAFVAAAAALQHPRPARALDRGLDRFGGALRAAPLRWPLTIASLATAGFAVFPIATRIYGDSRYILDDYSPANLAVHLRSLLSFGVLARGRASFILHDLVARAGGLSFEQSYQLVSVVCGGIFVFAFARLAARLPGVPGWTRGAIVWLALTDGANQLFFGHVENYTLPRLFGGLLLVAVLRRVLDPVESAPPARMGAGGRRGRRGGALVPVLFFALAVFFHSQMVVLAPTLLLWIGGPRAHRPAAVAAGLGAAVAGLAVAYFAAGATCYDYIYSGGRPDPRQLFLPVSTGCVGAPYLRYTLFSSAHLLDLAGSLFSISSAAILLVLAVRFRSAACDPRMWIFAASIGTALLHNFILNTAIGFPFDWDLLCVLSLPLLATAVFLLARGDGGGGERDGSQPAPAGNRHRPRAAQLLVLGAASIVLFGINTDPSAVTRRVEDMGVWLHRTYYGGSHYRLSANLSTISDPRAQVGERLRVQRRLEPRTYPDDREVAFLWEKLAVTAISIEDYDTALAAYRGSVRAQPSRWDREKPLGYLEAEVGDLGTGIRILQEYLAKAPQDGEAWLFLGDACARAGLTEEAQAAWTRFLSLSPEAPEAPRVRAGLAKLAAG
jgi:tetratricopeptide (TPR) repeat protein